MAMGDYLKEAVDFSVLMAREFPTVAASQFIELMRLARRHGRLAEQDCNGTMRAGADERCANAIVILCNQIGCRVKFGGDPRGYTVKVFLPSGRYNTWGGAEDGWGVPQ